MKSIASRADHDIMISQRHQDHIVKINYQDTTGDGTVVWTLGNNGDFTLTNPPSGDSFPWFSHQHGVEINSVDTLVTFDDGNTRCSNGVGGYLPGCDSRGQVLSLNETNKTATLLADADMGNFSSALGWGQTLSNGDYFFTSGFVGLGTPNQNGQAEEFNSAGTVQTFVQEDTPDLWYRAYRMPSMYAGCCGD
jgi:arylsulfate sulfotransferase